MAVVFVTMMLYVICSICIILSLDFHLATLQVNKPQQVVEAWLSEGFSSVNPSEEAPGGAKLLTVALSTQPAASANPIIRAFTYIQRWNC